MPKRKSKTELSVFGSVAERTRSSTCQTAATKVEEFLVRLSKAMKAGDVDETATLAFLLGTIQGIRDCDGWRQVAHKDLIREINRQLKMVEIKDTAAHRAAEARDRVAGLMNGKRLGKAAACKKVADEEGVALRTVQRWCKKT